MLRTIIAMMALFALSASGYAQRSGAITPREKAAFKFVEQMPSYNGDLAKYLSQTVRYPAAARKNGTQGKVYIQFIVDQEGWLTDAQVVKSSGSDELDTEALRVINTMTATSGGSPKWKPGKNNGQAVSAYFTQPIGFSLN